MKQDLKLGIIGCGVMGTAHAQAILQGAIPRAHLVGVSDAVSERRDALGVHAYSDAETLIAQSGAEAVIIATPHPSHASLCKMALERGLHVLCEKPLTVHIAEAQSLLSLPRRPGQHFGLVFHQRFFPVYQKLRALVQAGELGSIKRILYEITDWFRTNAYYKSGGWRASWQGEGGGVLINQCPHNLDLLQWICGMPVRLRAHCGIGKHHPIEVEDAVTAYLEFENGATGIFVTSTGEAPGFNRWEIVGDKATVVIEKDTITLYKNHVMVSEFQKNNPAPMSKPNCEILTIEAGARPDQGAQNLAITNFVDAVLDGSPLLAPAEEGLHQVMLSNAMIYSSATSTSVDLPLDGPTYATFLQDLIAHSRSIRSAS